MGHGCSGCPRNGFCVGWPLPQLCDRVKAGEEFLGPPIRVKPLEGIELRIVQEVNACPHRVQGEGCCSTTRCGAEGRRPGKVVRESVECRECVTEWLANAN